MTKLNLQLKGADKLIKKLSAISKEAEEETERTVEGIAWNIAGEAKLAAPVNKNPKITGGSLRQSITVAQPLNAKGKPTYTILANVRYAPYVEFGTGGLVQVPAELKDLAIRFKGKGIRKVNMLPQPFLYPAWKTGIKDLVNQLKNNLKRYGKDFS